MFLWIDPWVRKLGYSLIDANMNIIEAGILLQDKKNVKREDYFDRMSEIMTFFRAFLKKYKGKIKSVGIEKLFFTSFNQSNAEFVYGIRWALIILCKNEKIKIHEYSPIELKKKITGSWSAQKILLQNMIMNIFNLENLPEYDDAADALWLAYLSMKEK